MTLPIFPPDTDGLEHPTGGLFATAPQELGFAPGMVVRAFLVRRDEGNILINASDGALKNAREIEAFGGIKEIWLGHWHEAMTGAQAIADRFDASIIVHEADAGEAQKHARIDETFGGSGKIAPSIEAIPIPGHTPGSVTYLWHGPQARVLFTADSLFVKNGELRGVLLENSDREAFLAGLGKLRQLEFDLLVPWIAPSKAPIATPYAPRDFRQQIDALIARVQAGGNG